MTVAGSSAVLERYLSESEWEVVTAAHVRAEAHERLTLPGADAVLAYVFDGAATMVESDKTFALRAGTLVLLSCTEHTLLHADTAAEILVARVRPTRTPDGTRALPVAMVVSDFATREEPVASLLRAIGPRPEKPRAGDDLVCARIATTILTVAIRLWTTQECAPVGWPARVVDPFLSTAIEAVHDDLAREWTVAELASLSAMSRSAFAARFRADLGQSPLGYVTAARMEAAKTMLAEGASVSDSSRALGFSSDEGFRRAFRRHTGMAPSSWRGRAVTKSTPPIKATIPAMTPSVMAP